MVRESVSTPLLCPGVPSFMIFPLLLITGALFWLIGESLMLLEGGPGIVNGTLIGVALSIVAIGIWAFRDAIGMSRPGRSGIVLLCFGLVSLAMVQIIILTSGTLGALMSGEISYGDMVLTPFYLLAILFMVTGLGGFALHYRRDGSAPRWIALGFAALALVQFTRIFLPGAVPLHGIADIGVAVLLALLGVDLLRQRRSR